jgi:hypothetical protein
MGLEPKLRAQLEQHQLVIDKEDEVIIPARALTQ